MSARMDLHRLKPRAGRDTAPGRRRSGDARNPEHDLASLDPDGSVTPSRAEREQGLTVMSRLERALGRSDAERLATPRHPTRGEELGKLPARLRDPRLDTSRAPASTTDSTRTGAAGPTCPTSDADLFRWGVRAFSRFAGRGRFERRGGLWSRTFVDESGWRLGGRRFFPSEIAARRDLGR